MTKSVSEDTTTIEKIKGFKEEKFWQIMSYLAPVFCFLATFGIAFTPTWYLAFIITAITGFFYKKIARGIFAATIGIITGWGLYFIIQITTSRVMILIDQLLAFISGLAGLNWLLVIILIVVAALIGILGGTLGSSIRKLWELRKEDTKENEE